MFSNLSATIQEASINYPIMDSELPFSEYIALTRAIIEERRTELNQAGINADVIIDANAPYELYPDNPIRSGKQVKYGALLIHGLLDSPFSLREIGKKFQAHGILSRSILLPGHGTQPADLINVTYHDWLQSVRYGVETLRRDVEHVYLVGYSTGAALSIYQALQDLHIAGIVLLSPAIRIKAPVSFVVGWHYLMKSIGRNNRDWLYREKEIDYAKYQSIAFNPIAQVANLTKVIDEIRQHHALTTPILMVMSREDETVSSDRAIDYFMSQKNEESQFLLYTSFEHNYPDARIKPRLAKYPELHINHFSHSCLPFSASNPHYGNKGDFIGATNTARNNMLYGAYNQVEKQFFAGCYNLGLVRCQRNELTFNPDFDYMSQMIVDFVLGK